MLFRSWLGPDPHSEHDFRDVGHAHLESAEEPIAAESGVFQDLREGVSQVSVTEAAPHIRTADLEARYARRAFPGAPPAIPHEVNAALDGTQDCLPCHAFGGFNPQRVNYAPRAPHPERVGCMQCHVASRADDLFRPTVWQTISWPTLGNTDIEGGPPTIPHELHERGRCLSCHGGPAAAPSIRTSHPERHNCRQCHLEVEPNAGVFTRPTGQEDRP